MRPKRYAPTDFVFPTRQPFAAPYANLRNQTCAGAMRPKRVAPSRPQVGNQSVELGALGPSGRHAAQTRNPVFNPSFRAVRP